MRKIVKGSDSWYFEGEKIEPTEDEIQAWNDLFCDYCCMGSIFPKNKTSIERCEKQIPCPVCLGTGYKTHNYFKYFSDCNITNVSEPKLNPETFECFRRITLELNNNYSSGDGRGLHSLYERNLKILHLGNSAIEALEKFNSI